MWKRLNSNQMCEQFSYKEVFLIKRFLIERFYCIYIYFDALFIIQLIIPNFRHFDIFPSIKPYWLGVIKLLDFK